MTDDPTFKISDLGAMRFLELNIPKWDDDGEPEDCKGRISLSGVEGGGATILIINGCPVHLQGIEVTYENGLQQAANEMWQDELESLYGVYNPEAPFRTASINGREYVLYVTPHGE